MRVEAVKDQAERERIFELYKRERAKNFSRLFGVPVDASEAELKTGASHTRVREDDAGEVNPTPTLCRQLHRHLRPSPPIKCIGRGGNG